MLRNISTYLQSWTCAVVVLLFCCSTVLAPSLFSQSGTTGALSGTLRDNSGAVVPNATVTLTSLDTAQVRTTKTSSDGTYRFGLLAPGNYSVKFESGGFNALTVPSVTVTVTETAVLDQTLQVGAQTQQVEVRAETQAVQTESTAVGTVVTSQAITSVPLTTRNYTNLLPRTTTNRMARPSSIGLATGTPPTQAAILESRS